MEFDTEDSHEHDHDDEEVDDHHKDELWAIELYSFSKKIIID